MKNRIHELKDFYILWSTQGLSQLGSTMTNFALTLWLYQATGSALQTALLSICSYAPYVLMSIFAGALSDNWDKKRTMLVCDTLAACCTVSVFILLKAGLLCTWHLYLLNAVNGLMSTVQGPASDVATTLITPKKYYQKTSGLRSFSRSLITILHPMLATSLYALGGMNAVILVDLSTFFIAFFALLLFVKIPPVYCADIKVFACSAYEYQLGCYHAIDNTNRDARQGLFLPKHTAVFHDSHWIFLWWLDGRCDL
jgi:DHA3 family macrolide efflux protein-like MFS transporter